ncbi:hypothetical protein Dimus_006353 [Dionaea muscipula]
MRREELPAAASCEEVRPLEWMPIQEELVVAAHGDRHAPLARHSVACPMSPSLVGRHRHRRSSLAIGGSCSPSWWSASRGGSRSPLKLPSPAKPMDFASLIGRPSCRRSSAAISASWSLADKGARCLLLGMLMMRVLARRGAATAKSDVVCSLPRAAIARDLHCPHGGAVARRLSRMASMPNVEACLCSQGSCMIGQ